nr:hypothetical protein [Tanacetum cinerariifolium]
NGILDQHQQDRVAARHGLADQFSLGNQQRIAALAEADVGTEPQAARTGFELHPTGGPDPPGLSHRPPQATAPQRHPTRLHAGLFGNQRLLTRVQALVRVEPQAVAQRGLQHSVKRHRRSRSLLPKRQPIDHRSDRVWVRTPTRDPHHAQMVLPFDFPSGCHWIDARHPLRPGPPRILFAAQTLG